MQLSIIERWEILIQQEVVLDATRLVSCKYGRSAVSVAGTERKNLVDHERDGNTDGIALLGIDRGCGWEYLHVGSGQPEMVGGVGYRSY